LGGKPAYTGTSGIARYPPKAVRSSATSILLTLAEQLDALADERAKPWRRRRADWPEKAEDWQVETGRGAQSLLIWDNTFIEYAVWLCRTEAEIAL
jgi:hypothetical protein